MPTPLPTRKRWACQTHGSTGPFYEGGLCGPCLVGWAKGQGLVATQVEEVLCWACEGAGEKACVTGDGALMQVQKCGPCSGTGWVPTETPPDRPGAPPVLPPTLHFWGEDGLMDLAKLVRQQWQRGEPFIFSGKLIAYRPLHSGGVDQEVD